MHERSHFWAAMQRWTFPMGTFERTAVELLFAAASMGTPLSMIDTFTAAAPVDDIDIDDEERERILAAYERVAARIDGQEPDWDPYPWHPEEP